MTRTLQTSHPDSQIEQDRAGQALRAIAEQDGELRAFVWRADAVDAAPAAGGPLAGMPFAVKDIIDVAGMPTCYGAREMVADLKQFDAACVALLREAGAVPVGKTVTAEFAHVVPGATRNPHLPTHTPGGSSSGSAAAVAAGMVDMALGTQTGGSVIRPAAFCGVVGYKPSFGRVHRGGMQVLCDTLDTLGWFTRTVDETLAVAAVLMSLDLAPGARPAPAGRTPRVAVLSCSRLGTLSAAAQDALERCVDRLRAQGASIVRPDLDDDVDALVAAHATVMRYEFARGLLPIVRTRPQSVHATTRETVRKGLAIGHGDYLEQQHLRAQVAARWAARLADVDFIVTPSAPGEAPAGLDNTGSSLYNRIWSLLGWPCIHLPTAQGQLGLPVGVQWVGLPDTDAALLQWAAALHASIDTRAAR
ncbi:hypothetical protein CAL26_10160 [Bordetella genomosp. 9]|uniref:Amidase domain-containing protein n=1 Tax=Bordetella genomosp. 9 TaxID=1416803 RepID=A0A261RHG5_9BORD|nr:amidase [Bordetella genomosp. 9]OZI24060.1 hypothetical protein CAL26_10160 [Bordetella genomosp. 9]